MKKVRWKSPNVEMPHAAVGKEMQVARQTAARNHVIGCPAAMGSEGAKSQKSHRSAGNVTTSRRGATGSPSVLWRSAPDVISAELKPLVRGARQGGREGPLDSAHLKSHGISASMNMPFPIV